MLGAAANAGGRRTSLRREAPAQAHPRVVHENGWQLSGQEQAGALPAKRPLPLVPRMPLLPASESPQPAPPPLGSPWGLEPDQEAAGVCRVSATHPWFLSGHIRTATQTRLQVLPFPPALITHSALALCPPSLVLLPEGTSALPRAVHRVPGSAGLPVGAPVRTEEGRFTEPSKSVFLPPSTASVGPAGRQGAASWGGAGETPSLRLHRA